MAVAVADVVNAQLQTYVDALPLLMDKVNTASSRIKDGAKYIKQISNQSFRIPVITSRGGKFQAYSMAEGDMGRGTGFKVQQMTQTYFATEIAIEMDEETIETSKTGDQSMVNALQFNLKNALEELAIYNDVAFHNTNNGLIATATGYSSQVYTCADSAFGTNLLRDGQDVVIANSAIGTSKTSDVTGSRVSITSIDKVNKTVTVTGSISGAAATDTILSAGSCLVAAGAITPVWKNGLYYFNNNISSGTILGLNVATYPEIVASRVNGLSATVSPSYGLQLKDYIRQRRGPDALKGLIGFVHMAQRSQIYNQQVAISEYATQKTNTLQDVMPTAGDDFTWCGVNHVVDEHQNKSRIDWVNLKNWGIAKLFEPRFKTDLSGNKIFELRGSSGGVAAGYIFYVQQADNWFCIDNGAQGYMDALAVPSNWQ